MSNFGDDLFLYNADKNLAPILKQKNRNLYCASPISSNNEITNTKSLSPKFAKAIFAKNNLTGSTVRILSLLAGLILCKHVIFWGGSVFSSTSLGFRHKLLNLMSRHKLITCSAYGVSIGPFHDTPPIENFAKKFLSNFRFIGLRDTNSLNIADKLNLPQAVIVNDIAAGITEQPKAQSEQTQECIGISICRYESLLNNERTESELEFIIKSCDELAAQLEKRNSKKPLSIKILILNSHSKLGDHGVSQILSEKLTDRGLPHHTHIHSDSVTKTLEEINSCNTIISFRLHGAICAYLLNKPYILYEYHEKCADFNSQVSQSVTWLKSQAMGPIKEAKCAALPTSEYKQPYFENLHKIITP